MYQEELFNTNDSLDQKFLEYDRENPQIYKMFKAFSKRAMKRGFEYYGAKAIFEVIRWKTAVKANSDDFKVNNNYVSRYVRKLVYECPEFRDFFKMRTLKS